MNKIRNILLLSTTLLMSYCNAPTPPNKKSFKSLESEKQTASDSVHENLRIVRGLKEESKVNEYEPSFIDQYNDVTLCNLFVDEIIETNLNKVNYFDNNNILAYDQYIEDYVSAVDSAYAQWRNKNEETVFQQPGRAALAILVPVTDIIYNFRELDGSFGFAWHRLIGARPGLHKEPSLNTEEAADRFADAIRQRARRSA